jgi:dolichol-phosphate mannosyltransferase
VPLETEIDASDWCVPDYAKTEFAPRAARYAICVFVINEGQRLLAQLERMRSWTADVDVIVADGGSTDGSTEHARLQSLGVNTLLVKTGPGKLGAQMRMAFEFAIKRGYDGVIVMDGNNKDDPAGIPRFVSALDCGLDHVQGSRFIKDGQAINTPASRYWGVRLLHAPLISLAARFRYTDTTNGFRGYSARMLQDPRLALFRDVFSGYELHYYLAIRAARLGFRVTEVPVCRAYPKTGKVPTKIHGWRGNVSILKTLGAACLGKYDRRPMNTSRKISKCQPH